MNGVAGMAQLLLDSDLSPPQREFAESVKRSAARLLETIDDILELARIENNQIVLQKTEFSLRSVVADVLHRTAAEAESKGLDLAFLVRPGVPDRLMGDSVRIRQVLGHLVRNAIRFTGSGEVTVTVTAVAEASGGAVVRFQVEDSGVGIETDAMPMLFEPFASPLRLGAGGRQESSGLALAISRKLVERMGGQMGVESEPGQGSLFWFQLRLATVGEPAPPAENPLRGRRALIIDDSAVIRGAIAELLSGQGMYAVSAAEPQQAIQMLRLAELKGEPFDFALIDHDLPESSGIALAQAILDDPGCGRPRLILLVPYSQRAHCSEPVLAGVAGTLAKPVEESALVNALLHGLEAAPSLASLEEALRQEGGRILVIEDNTVNQHVIRRLLEKLGHETTIAPDAEAALSLLRERRFAAILMDCHLPGMDGFTATAAIRATEAGPHRTPIIAMTADALPGDRERCLAAGMDDYIAKPVSLGQLRSTLGRWLDHAHSSVSV
jgi:CheY-like chemotaxis protein